MAIQYDGCVQLLQPHLYPSFFFYCRAYEATKSTAAAGGGSGEQRGRAAGASGAPPPPGLDETRPLLGGPLRG